MQTRLAWLLTIVVAVIGSGLAKGPSADSNNTRKFEFVYQVKVDPAPGGTLKVWIPVATSDDNQDVTLKGVSSPVPTQTRRDSEYGNSVLYGEIQNAERPPLSP